MVAEASRAELPEATSVFFGGGTPSLLSPDQLSQILRVIPRYPDAEVTVECNPETVSRESLDGYGAAGANRISLGVQSLSPRVLHALGRQHDVGEVEPAVEAVMAAGFRNFNLDLIFGAAGESVGDWEDTLRLAIDFRPPHVSAYALTVEPGTHLAGQPDRHPDPDRQADMYALADDILGAAGLEWYEISNWARPGHECRHNLLYWSQGNYRGLGCAAHSHQDGRRWWNLRTPERYIRAVASQDPRAVEAASETLPTASRAYERLSLALRTRVWVPTRSLEGSADLLEGGLIHVRNDRAVLSVRGRLLANEVGTRLRSEG